MSEQQTADQLLQPTEREQIREILRKQLERARGHR